MRKKIICCSRNKDSKQKIMEKNNIYIYGGTIQIWLRKKNLKN